MASRTTPPALIALTLTAAALMAACGSSGSTGDLASATPAGTADATLTRVGPLMLGVPAYWTVADTAEGATIVHARGCDTENACPSFAVLQGGAIAGEVDESTAYVADATGCPRGSTPEPLESEPTLTEVVIDGVEGTLAELHVGCAEADGADESTVTQLQWYLPDAPGGPVLIVDRWSFDGLRSAVAGATWASTTP